ncbi:MAG TPA: COQ9 family protein [Acetobacteraceae bacterium]|jgi:ubiquinone biosynthesis protein COQ9|nr:COQ9 family protein [Acetobacteraceae bacterium]
MIRMPERSAERDAAITAMLPHVPFDGWGRRALAAGLADLRLPQDEVELLFPGGAVAMVEAFCDLADRQMEADAAALDQTGISLTKQVRMVIALRLARQRPHKEAVRRALAVLAAPMHTRQAIACTARTVDAIWHAAGDRSADFSWYTKRAILTAVYGATALFWLRDSSEDDAATLAFLDRRLAGIGRIGKLRGRAEATLRRMTPRRACNA